MHSKYDPKQLIKLNRKCHEHKWHFTPITTMQYYVRTHLTSRFVRLICFSVVTRRDVLLATPYLIQPKFLTLVISFVFIFAFILIFV